MDRVICFSIVFFIIGGLDGKDVSGNKEDMDGIFKLLKFY